MFKPLQDGYDSSSVDRSGLRRRPLCRGEVGLRGAMYEGATNRPDESTPGDECARCIIVGIPTDVCGRVEVREGECGRGRYGRVAGDGVWSAPGVG